MKEIASRFAPQAFEEDRERDTDNLDHGLSTVRITKQRLTSTPDEEAARRRRILTRGGRWLRGGGR